MLPFKVDRLKRSVYFKGSIFSRRLIIKLIMKKRTFFCIVKFPTTTTIERGPQMKDIISTLTMKELEKFESVFGQVELKRNYYQDRETGKYVYLLDQYLAFDGTEGMSPVVQDLAIELAVTGVSYRQAGKAIEKLLGYPVISHEGIRQQLLNTEVVQKNQYHLKMMLYLWKLTSFTQKVRRKRKKQRN